jgi:hypothetical protein
MLYTVTGAFCGLVMVIWPFTAPWYTVSVPVFCTFSVHVASCRSDATTTVVDWYNEAESTCVVGQSMVAARHVLWVRAWLQLGMVAARHVLQLGMCCS